MKWFWFWLSLVSVLVLVIARFGFGYEKVRITTRKAEAQMVEEKRESEKRTNVNHCSDLWVGNIEIWMTIDDDKKRMSEMRASLAPSNEFILSFFFLNHSNFWRIDMVNGYW